MENLQLANQAAKPLILANTATKDELLSRAKDAIEAGDQSMRDAAEALAIAQELHGASQAEMARAVGKSEAWVSLLLQWRRTEYKAESPFGPTTKAARLKHAEDRAASGASKHGKPCKVSIKPKADADDAETDADDAAVSAEKRKADYAQLEAERENMISTHAATSTDAAISTDRRPSTAEAKGNLRYAIDHWWPYLDDAGKGEMTAYFLEKAGVPVS